MTFQIKVFNTLSRKEEILQTIEPKHLKMYVCGPTVYDRPHLGNARSVVIYDLFFRFFQKIFPQVTYIRNITDVDDKINIAAREQKISIQELTQKIIDFFYQDIDALNVLRPTQEPRATTHIAEMIVMIEQLIKNGNAYVSHGHVLFDVNSYVDYGKLSNRSLDEMIAGSRVEIATYKKNPLDFVLWKPADAEDDKSAVFNSPWGEGRPGWHIECSAMSSKYLGADFDIHGGGADLQFPHHENEIAQSRCANPHSHYANFWIHNGFLTVNGEKMSKSLKNFITVRDLLNQGVNGTAIRFLLLSTHYRKPLDFNQKALELAQKTLEKFYAVLEEKDFMERHGTMPQGIMEFLADDLNIAKVIAALHEKVKEIKTNNDQKLRMELAASLDLLGLTDKSFFNKKNNFSEIDENYVNEQIALRIKFKEEKNFAQADEIRKNLLSQGVVLEDVAKDKTIWKR
jgi:cysteinyl-tRNA synthetase